jgi:ribonucleotide reductase alpha subunit
VDSLVPPTPSNPPETSPAKPATGLHFERRFTHEGVHPYDEVTWERRTAAIANEKGETVFEQQDCEVPAFWSQMATNVVVSKYFRGPLGTPRRETSVKQMISRVVDTIAAWGREGGYFASETDAQAFQDELCHLILHQKMSFNSPVWFNIGVPGSKPQASACQPYDARVATPDGLVCIGELVERDARGHDVFDRDGLTRIVATKANGRKEVFRVTLTSGVTLDATADHVVLTSDDRRGSRQTWKRIDELGIGTRLIVDGSRTVLRSVTENRLEFAGLGAPRERTGRGRRWTQAGDLDAWAALATGSAETLAVAEATLAGWLQGDGYVGVPPGSTCSSFVIELQPADREELVEVERLLDIVFPGVHRHVSRSSPDPAKGCFRVRLAGDVLWPYLDKWQLLQRGPRMSVPDLLWTASGDEIAGYLRGLFQADGYVALRQRSTTLPWPAAKVGLGLIAPQLCSGVQQLLLSLGIHSALRHHPARRDRQPMHTVTIGDRTNRVLFAELVGFPCARKARLLHASLEIGAGQTPKRAVRFPRIKSIESRGVMDVFDIQTESGNYISNHVVVHNCFINSVDDTMDSILTLAKNEGMLFKYGSGTGTNLSPIRSSVESLAGGGTASGPVSFMKGFDAFAGVIKSGGTTRRAAKMVILNADHPDIEEFITCKVSEERKAWALIEAGYDSSFTGEAYASIFFQNSNNSVRVTDEFMRAVEEDKDWNLYAVTDRSRVLKTVKARELMKLMAESAWQCGDPGIQYDTTINDWHTSSNTARINASNPCFPGDARVHTTEGPLAFAELYEHAAAGRWFHVYTHRATASNPGKGVLVSTPVMVMQTGIKPLVALTFSNGRKLRCTPNHRLWTRNRGYVPAADLTSDDQVLFVERVEQPALIATGRSASDRAEAPSQTVGFTAVEARASRDIVTSLVSRSELPAEPVYNLTEPIHHSYIVDGFVVANCSEFMYLDDTSCNLASLNLMRFLNDDGSIDIDAYRHAIHLTITAQEMLVSNASYPTEKITRNSHEFRPLGLGYANLGALLMARGVPYDSPQGRDLAASLTAILTGEAYAQSARVAREIGPFTGYAVNRQPMLRVIGKHREAAYNIPTSRVEGDLIAAARHAWDEAHELGARHGYRNSQTTVLAPTGTISFLMDCDTTGVEPDIALVKYKKLVGGGMLKIVNNTVPAALRRLGYGDTAVADIIAYVDANDTIEGAPALHDEDVAVFDCAFTPQHGKRSIAWQGHVRMMAATQPFISGAISKTINMPGDSSVEDIERAYIDGWKMGLKAIAIYRDGSKRSQPLATSLDKTTGQRVQVVERPLRRRLPAERQALTHRFEVSGHEGYITVGMYEDGTPGEIFLKMAKEGSTVSGLMDSFATAISLALQYGVPLQALVDKFSHTRFEPQGFTKNPEIPIAKSVMDYIFKWLASRYLSLEERDRVGIIRREEGETASGAASAVVPSAPTVPVAQLGVVQPTTADLPGAFVNQADAPSCSECGSLMVRNGACYKCFNCGATSGCS